jgi:hypothetical protein
VANKRLILTPPERQELQRRVRSRVIRAEDSRRARVILELASGRGVREAAADLHCSTSYVQRWAGRFRAGRLYHLFARGTYYLIKEDDEVAYYANPGEEFRYKYLKPRAADERRNRIFEMERKLLHLQGRR